jgi:hypothetical protein
MSILSQIFGCSTDQLQASAQTPLRLGATLLAMKLLVGEMVLLVDKDLQLDRHVCNI